MQELHKDIGRDSFSYSPVVGMSLLGKLPQAKRKTQKTWKTPTNPKHFYCCQGIEGRNNFLLTFQVRTMAQGAGQDSPLPESTTSCSAQLGTLWMEQEQQGTVTDSSVSAAALGQRQQCWSRIFQHDLHEFCKTKKRDAS